jgi:predicted amidophosphoribosyltransferase
VAGFCAACLPLVERAPEGLLPSVSCRAAAAYVYGGPMADAIARLKYAERTELAPLLGQLLAQAALPYAACVQCVIPLPLHPRKLRERGYNQSALLASWVARGLGLPLDTRTLARVRDTQPQAGLDRAERPANVRGAFRARPRLAASDLSCGPPGVLLIDDVRTTGATLAAAAEALCTSGYPSIFTLALAAASG